MANETEQSAEIESAARYRVDLWVRRPVCGPRTTVIDRLSRLSASGVLEEFSVTTWPEEIALTGPKRQGELLETIEQFESWAADRGLSLRPPFETRTASLLVGDSEDVLVTPMLLAAAYEDGELVGIYPCSDGSKTWTIPEFLDKLEGGAEESPAQLTEESAFPAAPRTS